MSKLFQNRRIGRMFLGVVTCTAVAAMLALPAAAQFGPPNPAAPAPPPQAQPISTRSGDLLILEKGGGEQIACPLKHTAVIAQLSGLTGRVRVRQTFTNPLARSIEAVYVFPLPQDAAVDDMTMTIGARKIKAQIKPREEARQIYEAAKAKGQTVSMLDQERPNIFTQSVANIAPNAEVVVEISYVENLKWEEGVYEWSFPTVVGPRYMPGTPAGKSGTGWSPDTGAVPDASKISPPVALPGMRAGHDLSLSVDINVGQSAAGTQLRLIESTLHAVSIENTRDGATVELANKQEIPNKDFVLRYRTATDEIGDAFSTHTDSRGRFFSLMLQPPQRVTREQTVPRELIFVLDTSGSMSGYPIEKAKAVMSRALDALGPRDEFNLITFAGSTRVLWPEPKPSTPENRQEAQAFLAGQSGGGGTEMMKAINAALEGQDLERIRVVCFMTDGYVGNDMEIVGAVKKNAGNARVFSFGIGNSVNRFLLDGMAAAGRGAVEYVLLANAADAAANRFFERINAPVLTDIALDWGGLPVEDVYPKQVPDLFSNNPILVTGRIRAGANVPANSTITLRGRNAAGGFQRRLSVGLNKNAHNDVLPALWARSKIGALMMQEMSGLQRGIFPEELKEEITALGIEYRLMTQFTSFVAVEEKVVNIDGMPLTIAVPVEMPDGVSYEGVFGGEQSMDTRSNLPMLGLRRSIAAGSAGIGGMVGPVGPMGAPPPMAAGILAMRDERSDAAAAVIASADKLAAPLRGLAAKVEAAAAPGEYSQGKLRVEKYRVRIQMYLRDSTPETRAALEKLGFVKQWESDGAHLLIGTLDVRQLEEAAKLQAVTRIEPVEI